MRSRVVAKAGRHREDGFGLIDCVVAMVILMAVLVPTAYLFSNVLSQSASARERLTALSLAEKWIETLNNQGPPSNADNQPEVGTALSEGSSTLSGITYGVSAEFNWTDATGGTPDFCSSNTSPVLGLQVTVSWASNQSITDQAILNFPASGDLTDGYLAIQVNGDPAGSPPADVYSVPWATRVKSVPVQVSGSNLATPLTLYPASTGCTFVALAPGTYTVQVGPGPSTSYVANYNEASSETQPLATQASITVIAAEVTEGTFQYDEGTDVGLAYPTSTTTADGLVCPNTGPVICLAFGQMPASSTVPNTSPEATGIVETSSGWSIATFPSTLTEIQSVACTSSACIAVGYSSSGAAAAVTTNGTSWTSSTLPSGVSQLTSILCPSGATTFACVAIGPSTSSSGALLTATISGSTVTWTKDTIPTTTAVSQIVCPGTSSGQPVCFVTATTSSGATIFSNSGSSSPGTTWTTYTVQSGLSMSTLVQIACNSTTFCVAIGTGKTSSGGSVGPLVIQLSSGTWDHYTNSTGDTPTAFTSIACTTSGSNCWASATTSSSPFVAYLSSGTTWKADTGVPSSATAVNSLTCPGSTSGCFALYTTSSAPGVISLSSGTAWSTASLPSGVISLEQLVCPSTSACYATGTSSSAAIIDVLSSSTWSSATFSGTGSGGNPVSLSGIACTAATTCVAAGATETAALILADSSSTPATFSGSSTPTGLSGLYLDNPPIMVSNANLQPATTIEMSAPTTSNGPQTEVGPLFPFASGYSIAAGYCASELSAASASAATTPGATPTTTPAAPTVTLPMGVLPIEAVTSSGVPISGATITIVDSCSSQLTPLSSGSFPALASPPASPSNPTSYTMPTSGIDGMSRLAVIYGTYQVTVTSGATHATTTVTVNPTSIVVGTTTYYMPALVPVAD